MDFPRIAKFRHENDFRTEEILNLQREQDAFRSFYEGKFGAFFDNLVAGTDFNNLTKSTKQALGGTKVLPRAEAFLRKHQDGWNAAPIETPNYLQMICEIYAHFVLGNGVNVVFQAGDEENSELWEFFEDKQSVQSKLVWMLHETIFAGYGGLHATIWNDTPALDKIFAYNYYPEYIFKKGYTEDDIYLNWVFRVDNRDKKKSQNLYDYVIHYTNDGKGNVRGEHKVFDKQQATPFTVERPNLLQEEILALNGGSNIGKTGVENIVTRGIPLYMLKSNKRQSNDLGSSYFRDMMGNLQDLIVLTTIASDELRKHFNSKIAIPESAVSMKADGTAQVKHRDYFIMSLDSQKPEYITKDATFFEPLANQGRTLLVQLCQSAHLPPELLVQRETGTEMKVEVAKIKNKPFIKSVNYFQREIELIVKNMVNDFFKSIGKEGVEFEVILEDPFEISRVELLEELVIKFDRNIISRQRFLRESDGLEPDEAKEMIKERADEDKEFGLGESAFDQFSDGGEGDEV